MKATLLLLAALLFAYGTLGAEVPFALWQFGSMIQCYQPGVNPFLYNNYGCWCGFGGSGTPRDGVDRCCNAHDLCYQAARKNPACRPLVDVPYTKQYDYTCTASQVECSASNNACQATVCDCDQAAAFCFSQHTYNPENKNLDKSIYCK
ncbi:phospholipase A2-like [Paramormyrops kingsleyae]|nr:phospholipase A2-like [Paramormyrops kingsleyae]